MGSHLEKQINIKTLAYKPEIPIWYISIPEIIKSLFKNTGYQDDPPLINEVFLDKDFTTRCFKDDEINTINSFKAFKKQTEWISGRYLIKNMIRTLFLNNHSLDQINILYEEKGAPFVKDHPDISFSLSHSNEYTIAACSMDNNHTLGIDLEKIRKIPDAGFLKTAFTEKEREHLDNKSEEIFKHWAIKEAYLKYIKKGFHESLHKVEVIKNQIFHHGRRIPVDIFSAVIEKEYTMALVSN